MKIHASLFSGFLLSISALVMTVSAADINMEQGILTEVGSNWQTVNLTNTYIDPVVVVTPQYTASDLPVVPRIRNALVNSFELRVQNPSDNPISGYTVQYIVVEAGVYTDAEHGITMEAAKKNSIITDVQGKWVGEAGSYSNNYSSPVVFGQVMTANNDSWSVFWSRGNSRMEPVSSSDFNIGKHVGQDMNQYRADETLGYIVMESGSGTINGQTYLVGLGEDNIMGVDDVPPPPYELAANPWEYVVASQAAMDGDDGSWVVLNGSDSLTEDNLLLILDEDQIKDSERHHTNEQVGYFVSTVPSDTEAQVFSTDVSIGDPDSPANLEVYGTSSLGPVTMDVLGGNLGPADNVDYGMAPFWLSHDGSNVALDGDQLSSDAEPFIIQNTNPNGGIVFHTGASPTDRLTITADGNIQVEGSVSVSRPAGDIPMITY